MCECVQTVAHFCFVTFALPLVGCVGHGRVELGADHFTEPKPWHNRSNSMLVYLPTRTATVFKRVD